MKKSQSILILFFLITAVYAQEEIVFEEVVGPNDSSIEAVQVSPIGEYFVKLVDSNSSIYTSLNGADWTKETIMGLGANNTTLNGVFMFFADGTPLLQSPYSDGQVYIRRNGLWEVLNPTQHQFDQVETAFISDDILYFVQEGMIYTSDDKGLSATPYIEVDENVFNPDIVVYDDRILISYNNGQNRVYSGTNLVDTFEADYDHNLIYSGTNEVLYLHFNNYSIYDLETYELVGESITPNSPSTHIQITSFDDEIFAMDDHFFHVKDSLVYRSESLLLGTWEVYKTMLPNTSYESVSVDSEQNVYSFVLNSNALSMCEANSEVWTTEQLAINNPYILEFLELKSGKQIVRTYNSMFTKNENDGWIKDGSITEPIVNIEPGIESDYYVNCAGVIYYSSDGTPDYETISAPLSLLDEYPNILYVLAKDVLLTKNEFIGYVNYSVDNGQTWNSVGAPSSLGGFDFKLIGDEIYVVSKRSRLNITRIHKITNQVANDEINGFSTSGYDYPMILDNGKILFEAAYNGDFSNLITYDFVNGLQEVGESEDILPSSNRLIINNSMYAFDENNYQVFKDGELNLYNMSGYSDGYHKVRLANSGHLTSITNNSKLHRSVEKLSIPSAVKDDASLNLPLTLSPNPTSDLLTLNLNEDIYFVDYQIINLQGVILDSKKDHLTSKSISVDNLIDGIYHLRVTDGLRSKTMRFVKI